jgi:hypothetical protein
MVWVLGRVRQSRAKDAAGIENRDCHWPVRIESSLKREGNAAESATDDDHAILLCQHAALTTLVRECPAPSL